MPKKKTTKLNSLAKLVTSLNDQQTVNIYVCFSMASLPSVCLPATIACKPTQAGMLYVIICYPHKHKPN